MGWVEFESDTAQATPFAHVWEHTVGSGHASLALRADWQSQLRQCHEELGFRHVRFHGLLSDPMGTLIRQKDQLIYSFFNADQVWDFLLSIGMRPFVELSFMPEAIASGGQTVFAYRANVTPPKNYQDWRALIHKLLSHWAERYGLGEMGRWYFEVWNEPNMEGFWTGRAMDYFTLYRHTADVLKAIDAHLHVGGPATAHNEWIDAFIEFCERERLPADFISTHQYPTDGQGSGEQNTEETLARTRRGVMHDWARETRRRAGARPLYYTEWNSSSDSRDPLHDEPYAAAFIVKTVMESVHLVDGYSFWTFSDIFAETYFPSVPFHGGFGLLTLHGIAKPAYRAFELLHRLGTQQCPVAGRHHTVDVWVVREQRHITVMITNHALPRHPIDTELVRVLLRNAPRPQVARIERIDASHANPKRVWQEWGAPEYLSGTQVEHLHAASRLLSEEHPLRTDVGTVCLEVTMPPHSVAAVRVDCGSVPEGTADARDATDSH